MGRFASVKRWLMSGMSLRLYEAQRESIARAALLARRLGRAVPVALVVGTAQHVTLRVELEPRSEHFLLNDLLVDPMQRLGVARPRSLRGTVINDPVHASLLQRVEHFLVELRGVCLLPDEVV